MDNITEFMVVKCGSAIDNHATLLGQNELVVVPGWKLLNLVQDTSRFGL